MQKKYIVTSNLKDDTGYHAADDIILMDEDQAAPLVEIGCLKPAVEDITPHASPEGPDGFPERTVNQTPPANVPPQVPVQPVQQAVPQVDPQRPKQPTQEQIAQTIASVA
jgi:hypothetical protein